MNTAVRAQNVPFLPPAWAALLKRSVVFTAGLAVVGAGAAIAAALLTYAPGDPSLNTATAGTPQNALGLAGAVIADAAVQIAGLAAVLLAAVIGGWGVRLMRGEPVGWRVQRGRQPFLDGVLEGEPPRFLRSFMGGRREPSRSSEGRAAGLPTVERRTTSGSATNPQSPPPRALTTALPHQSHNPLHHRLNPQTVCINYHRIIGRPQRRVRPLAVQRIAPPQLGLHLVLGRPIHLGVPPPRPLRHRRL